MSRTPIIGGNWKMNLDLAGAQQLAANVRNRLGSQRGAEVVVFPAFPFLVPVIETLREGRVAVGAQDLSTEPKGAFTGAVSASMLASVGCTHVLIGHSERRHVFGDDNATVATKLKVALEAGLKPVLCVGETLEQRRAGQTFAVIDAQLQTGLAGGTSGSLASVVIAYEPVWAIGTGETATPEQAQEVHAHIRRRVADLLGPTYARAVRIQYGGSVKPGNAKALMAQSDIDGALVGGASLKADDFAAIVRAPASRPD
jgi:triosephosphate isomerase (TIM)